LGGATVTTKGIIAPDPLYSVVKPVPLSEIQNGLAALPRSPGVHQVGIGYIRHAGLIGNQVVLDKAIGRAGAVAALAIPGKAVKEAAKEILDSLQSPFYASQASARY